MDNRYEFIYLFDVKDGNPNGDPDASNYPRIDFETGQGLVTDVCLKRKIRNYVLCAKQEQSPYQIYIKEKSVLERQNALAFQHLELAKKNKEKQPEARSWMCQNFYDVRTFGAVMTNKEANCGQVRGPVQLTFARSIDPIVCLEHTITRVAVATEKEEKKQDYENKTMGRKYTVPYGLYRAHGFISGNLAKQTGFSYQDLELFFEALQNMFDQDRSASKGMMSCRGLYVFKHQSVLGNAPAHLLFENVHVKKKESVNTPTGFSDYDILIDEKNIPKQIALEKIF